MQTLSLSSAQRAYDNQSEDSTSFVESANPCQCGETSILGLASSKDADFADYSLQCPICKRESKASGSTWRAIELWNGSNPL